MRPNVDTLIILRTGVVNVDFADVRAVMIEAGAAVLALFARLALIAPRTRALVAICSPLRDCPIEQAKRVMLPWRGHLPVKTRHIDLSPNLPVRPYKSCSQMWGQVMQAAELYKHINTDTF
jgi:hypothetical protein